MTKKLTWEVEKTSLVIRIADGDRKTEWTVRKTSPANKLRGMLGEMMLELSDEEPWEPIQPTKPMLERVRTVDAEELAELQRYQPVQAASEEASRAAQAARVRELNIGAKWFEADDDDTYGIPIPDYDTGEV